MHSGVPLTLAALSTLVGGLVIAYGIGKLRRWLRVFESTSPPVFRMSCADPFREFGIPADGVYDIWIEGPRFRVNPLIDMQPEVRGPEGPLRLRPSVFRTNMTRGSTNTMRIAGFSAREGGHVLGLRPAVTPPGRLDLRFGRALAKRLPWPRATREECFLQIRTRDPLATDWLFQGVLPIVVGANLMIGGIIAGVLDLAGVAAR